MWFLYSSPGNIVCDFFSPCLGSMSFHFGLSNSSGAKHEFSRARLQNPKVYYWWFYWMAFLKPGAFQDCITDIFFTYHHKSTETMCQVGLWCPQILMHFVFWAKSKELPLTIGLCHCNFSQKSENGTSSNKSSFAFNCQTAFSIRSTISQQVQRTSCRGLKICNVRCTMSTLRKSSLTVRTAPQRL